MQVDINTEEGVKELEAYITILQENPQYAAAILNAPNKDDRFGTAISESGERDDIREDLKIFICG